MKVRVQFEISGRKIDEVVDGTSSETLLAEAKSRVAKELGWKGLFLSAMTPLQFAQMAVKAYNERFHAAYEVPTSADEFLAFGEQTGNLTVLER